MATRPLKRQQAAIMPGKLTLGSIQFNRCPDVPAQDNSKPAFVPVKPPRYLYIILSSEYISIYIHDTTSGRRAAYGARSRVERRKRRVEMVRELTYLSYKYTNPLPIFNRRSTSTSMPGKSPRLHEFLVRDPFLVPGSWWKDKNKG